MPVLLRLSAFVFTLAWGAATLAWAEADFQKGIAAHKAGDFATALKDRRPLTEQALRTQSLSQRHAELVGSPAEGLLAQSLIRIPFHDGEGPAEGEVSVIEAWIADPFNIVQSFRHHVIVLPGFSHQHPARGNLHKGCIHPDIELVLHDRPEPKLARGPRHGHHHEHLCKVPFSGKTLEPLKAQSMQAMRRDSDRRESPLDHEIRRRLYVFLQPFCDGLQRIP